MKKILPLFLFLFLGFDLVANPLMMSGAWFEISELRFNKDASWDLELWVFYENYNSIILKTCSGTVAFDNLSATKEGYIVISSKDIDDSSEFRLDREGDSLSVCVIAPDIEVSEDLYNNQQNLIFGNQPGALVGVPQLGQSIICTRIIEGGLGRYFQSVSFISDESGIGAKKNFSAKINGKVYNKEGELVRGKRMGLFFGDYRFFVPIILFDSFMTADCEILFTDENGYYEVEFPPIDINWVKVYEREYWKVPMQPVSLNLEPRKTYEVDIHLTGDFFTSIEENTEDSPIKFYPNPVKEDMKLKYKINLPVNTMNVEVEVISLSGSVLMKKKITENVGEIDLPRSSQGTCILNCKVDGKKQYSTKLLLAK